MSVFGTYELESQTNIIYNINIRPLLLRKHGWRKHVMLVCANDNDDAKRAD